MARRGVRGGQKIFLFFFDQKIFKIEGGGTVLIFSDSASFASCGPKTFFRGPSRSKKRNFEKSGGG